MSFGGNRGPAGVIVGLVDHLSGRMMCVLHSVSVVPGGWGVLCIWLGVAALLMCVSRGGSRSSSPTPGRPKKPFNGGLLGFGEVLLAGAHTCTPPDHYA